MHVENENYKKTRSTVVFPIILHGVEKYLTNSVVLFQYVVSML